MNDHPDIEAEADGEADAEAKDVALIKGLQELSNKSGRHEELPGPEPQETLGEGENTIFTGADSTDFRVAFLLN